jgi:hypothetical protein
MKKVAFVILGGAAFAFAVFQEGAARAITDAVIVAAVSAAVYAAFVFLMPRVNAALEAAAPRDGDDVFAGAKFVARYPKIRRILDGLAFVRPFNGGDYDALVGDVDAFVRSFQAQYGGRPTMHDIDILADKRDALLKTVQGFFVSTPLEADKGRVRKGLLALQSVTWHMIKKIQEQSGLKSLVFPRPYEAGGLAGGSYVLPG